jgi:hypothetical protein
MSLQTALPAEAHLAEGQILLEQISNKAKPVIYRAGTSKQRGRINNNNNNNNNSSSSSSSSSSSNNVPYKSIARQSFGKHTPSGK